MKIIFNSYSLVIHFSIFRKSIAEIRQQGTRGRLQESDKTLTYVIYLSFRDARMNG